MLRLLRAEGDQMLILRGPGGAAIMKPRMKMQAKGEVLFNRRAWECVLPCHMCQSLLAPCTF